MYSPSAGRNRKPVCSAFGRHMPHHGHILEIGSGTGEHAIELAGKFPELQWHPGDPDERSRASITAWTAHAGLPNISRPHCITTLDPEWNSNTGIPPVAGIVCINMIHIAPFTATENLFGGSGKLLPAGGKIFLYGPFSRNGIHTAQSNENWHHYLVSRNAAWGVRDLDNDIIPLAERHHLRIDKTVNMPANNLVIIFKKKKNFIV